MPVISNLVYTVTDSTIVATWTTDTSSDSNLTAGGKAAIDNGVAANSTSHQCIVTGLSPSTTYSCVVTSGGSSSSPQNVTTNASPNRVIPSAATLGTPTLATNHGDTNYTFVSSDGVTYVTECDGYGFIPNTPNTGFNAQICTITNPSTLAGSNINSLSNYGVSGAFNGTDAPGSNNCTNKISGLFGLNGNLFIFFDRQGQLTWRGAWFGNIAKSTDHGATWNNWTAVSTFNANGNPVIPQNQTEPFMFASKNYGWVSPIRYGADDGTLGYNVPANGIDGGNAYVYMVFHDVAYATNGPGQQGPIYLTRLPRILFDRQSTNFEYWVGPSSPTPLDFTNDANWNTSDTAKTAVFNETSFPDSQPVVTFVAGLNCYLLSCFSKNNPDSTHYSLRFFAGLTPAGPWTFLLSSASSQLYYNPIPIHADCYSNSLTDNIAIRVIYSGAVNNFTTSYYPTVSTLTLRTGLMSNLFIDGAGTTTAQVSNQATLAFPGPIQVGDLLMVAWRRTSGTLNNVKGALNASNWTIAYDQADASGTIGGWAYTFSNFAGSETAQINYASSLTTVLAVAQYRGANAARTPFAAAKQIFGTSGASNSMTTTAGDLVLGIAEQNGAQTAFTAGSAYILREQGGGAAGKFVAIEDNLSSSGGTTTADFSWTPTSANGVLGIGAFFAQSFNITGNAGTAFASISYSGPVTGSVTADGTGNFTIPVSVNGTYTIIPSLAGYLFSPTIRNVDVVGANVSGVNFTASLTGVPNTITITMLDATTVVLSIPNGYTANQFVSALRKSGGVFSAAADPVVPATWWPYKDWKKVVTS